MQRSGTYLRIERWELVPTWLRLSAVYLPAVSHLDNNDQQNPVFNSIKNPIIANSNPIEVLFTSQKLLYPQGTGIFGQS
jgi:hypothetical protein